MDFVAAGPSWLFLALFLFGGLSGFVAYHLFYWCFWGRWPWPWSSL